VDAYEHGPGLNRRRLLGGLAGGGATLLAGNLLTGGARAQDGTPATGGGTITLYNGQHTTTTQAIADAFTAKTGTQVRIRKGEGAELANQIVAEGDASPADVIFTESSPNLELLAEKGLLAPVDAATLASVPAQYNSTDGLWVGIAARAAVLVYNPSLLAETSLPGSVLNLAGPPWKDKIGVAPSEGDFQPVVTAVLKLAGNEMAQAWAEGLAKNAKTYQGNTAILNDVEAGNLAAGIINHYYWFRLAAENGADAMRSKLSYFGHADPGAIVVVSGAAAIASSKVPALAQQFLAFMVSAAGQQVLIDSKDYEYPLGSGVQADPLLVPFAELDPPALGPADLGDGQAAVSLLQDAGLL
jgi:iron(III) transport system substrate-binding protein